MKTSKVTPSFYYVFNIPVYCNDSIPRFMGNLWRALLLGNHLNRGLALIGVLNNRAQKNFTIYTHTVYTNHNPPLCFEKTQCLNISFIRYSGYVYARVGRGEGWGVADNRVLIVPFQVLKKVILLYSGSFGGNL